MSTPTPTAWSCHARQSGDVLELLYGDELGRRYVYDSNVQNHLRVTEGDLLVIRDRQLVFGYGVVERIESHPAIKPIAR